MTRGSALCNFPGVYVINPEQVELLGAPLGDSASVDVCVNGKIKMLERMGDRLRHLHSHDAFTLLCHSFAIPEMLHVLRTSPCFKSSHLAEYDGILHVLLCKIANIKLEETDPAWLPSSEQGGVGHSKCSSSCSIRLFGIS